MPESPNPGQSYEAWIESKAGACPPGAEWDGFEEWFAKQRGRDWPMEKPPPFPADDEDDEAPRDLSDDWRDEHEERVKRGDFGGLGDDEDDEAPDE